MTVKNRDEDGLEYLRQRFPRMSEAKIEGGMSLLDSKLGNILRTAVSNQS